MSEHPADRSKFRRNRLAIAAAGLLVVGGAAGAVTVAATRPTVTMAPATPVAIRSLQSDGIVTIRGNVAEVYGNKFVMADRTGRALVDLGREGEDGTLVTAGQPVTVQGQFEQGFVHAAFLVGADGKVTALGPVGGPPRGRPGPGPDGPGPDDPGRGGPDGGPGGPGAPPPPAGVVPPAPTAMAPGTLPAVPASGAVVPQTGTAPLPAAGTAPVAQPARGA
ncbi:hypothetical protein U1707_04415 [Sphingomonas sp. PB2P12]|uniref:hypothetical protein n=1 Tax=Sphingomonas sandaracina TaxID=3096157 RepID=UPI002FC606C8